MSERKCALILCEALFIHVPPKHMPAVNLKYEV